MLCMLETETICIKGDNLKFEKKILLESSSHPLKILKCNLTRLLNHLCCALSKVMQKYNFNSFDTISISHWTDLRLRDPC